MIQKLSNFLLKDMEESDIYQNVDHKRSIIDRMLASEENFTRDKLNEIITRVNIISFIILISYLLWIGYLIIEG